MEKEYTIVLEPVKEKELDEFKVNLQKAFAIAVNEFFGNETGEAIPSDKDMEESFNAPNTEVYHIVCEGKTVGGVVLSINGETQHNALDFLFVLPRVHNKGIGLAAWHTVEKQYPETVVWETVTPYFEKRNIHFYVNKCGFKVVEFWNRYHPDPYMFTNSGEQKENTLSVGGEAFRFEKMMK